MNSEELELSLRTEFESYLKDFLAGMRQEVSEFRKNFETEFEKHRSQTDEALRRLMERFEGSVEFDKAFNESVVEHLRLARDEGATITAVAIGEAEKLKEETAPAADYDRLRDAINEISSKTTQSEILTSLVDHASSFAPRGAFFIVKNEQFVGWRGFGDETAADDATVRSVQFPMTADTVLADSVNGLATTAAGFGAHADNEVFLGPLGFGTPDRMYAIPLVARGRGVAVLYADYGQDGITLQPEALETLVRVAGLTVELAAAGVQTVPAARIVEKPAPSHAEEKVEAPAAVEPEVRETQVEAVAEQQEVPSYQEKEVAPAVEESVSQEAPAAKEAQAETGFEYEAPAFQEETVTFEEVTEQEPAQVEEPETVEESFPQVTAKPVEAADEQPVPVERFGETVEIPAEEVTYFEPVEEKRPAAEVEQPSFAQPETEYEYAPAEVDKEEFPEVIDEPAPAPVAAYVPQPEPAFEGSNGSPAPAVSVAQPAAVESAPAARTRYRDRNVDLPIEVSEEERRLHHDARRFARLLVSEIKLYNEQKVADGRQSGDLYDRLREAIDRSREMYDKRVQQPVAEKFDYFHYELVTSLAEGQDVKLGASYPGSRVPA